MRVKSHWFKSGAPKSATEIAGAAAFIVFRIAQNALKNMRNARFELPAGARYFAFLAEFLVFLTLAADRIAHRRGDDAWRVEFTTALANRVGGFLGRQRVRPSRSRTRRRDQAAVRRAGQRALAGLRRMRVERRRSRLHVHALRRPRVADVMEQHEQTWAVSQVIDSEAPEAVER